jgi:acetyl-CoA carboxylase carboxyltransferase component
VIAVLGPEGAVNIVFKALRAAASEPEQTRSDLVQQFREKFANPYVAASRGFLDDIIDPRETRPRLIDALEMLQAKRETMPPKKHGNIPL